MPVILKGEVLTAWLDAETGKAEALELLQQNRGGELVYYPVSKDVGNVANKGAELIEKAQ